VRAVTAGILACNPGVTKGNEDRKGAEKSLFSLLPSVLALAALIQGFFSPQAIAFSVQFTLRCRCTGALLARTRLWPRKLLSPT
jgi:hypothetical protein